jgi:hypothetical protein
MTPASNVESNQSLRKNTSFLIETLYLIVIIGITLLVFFDFINVGFFVGTLRFSHWLGIIGAIFMLAYAPLFYILKRQFPKQYGILMNTHVFGFTTSFLLVSIHFAGQLSRPLQFYPDLGAGLALYIITAILVASGYFTRYNLFKLKSRSLPHFNRWLHVSLISGLYIVLIVHTLLNFFLV